MVKAKQDFLLPLETPRDFGPNSNGQRRLLSAVITLAALGVATLYFAYSGHLPGALVYNERESGGVLGPFYHSIKTHDDLCVGGISHSGYIGLKGDSEDTPKRSFFWYFEAQNDPENAPVILTIGGGPGTSGMVNPLFGQSHCKVSADLTTYPNPNAWTENFNLLALDHPIGVGYSYGTMVNNSRAAAYDVYDFLLKFFHLYPHLAKNQFVLAGGSYGGVYIPHIATVIHEQNTALAARRDAPGARHINLESMMISNPMSDWLSHNRWALQQRCYLTDFYNASTCADAFSKLPACLEAIQLSYMTGTLEHRLKALKTCYTVYPEVVEGRDYQNVELRCDGTIEDCYPAAVHASAFMNLPNTKEKLGVPEGLNFTFVRMDVWKAFLETADMDQQAYLLYTPLLEAGYRLLHYIGKLDANCAWPGVLSTLRLIPSPYQSAFLDAPDVPVTWSSSALPNATVRAIGERAGDFTYLLMDDAGHFVTHDQPALVKEVVRRWVRNVGWNETIE